MRPLRRIRIALFALAGVVFGGTVGYMMLGFGLLDALYQTVTTVWTVGFREVQPLSTAGQVFTIVLIIVGVGTVLYTLGVVLEALIEGHLREHLGRRRMDRRIQAMTDHVIICGWGRVGRACARQLGGGGRDVVVIDRDVSRIGELEIPTVLGDVTDDATLERAGIAHAHALIAALDTDADNVYVTLSSRALRPDLVIIARARTESSKSKLVRAGATRTVNPQALGGRRMASFATQPHVAEFLDGVMHDEETEFRMEQIPISEGSSLAGRTVLDAGIGDTTGVLLLAIRSHATGPFLANPSAETSLKPGSILIAVGTPSQLEKLRAHAC